MRLEVAAVVQASRSSSRIPHLEELESKEKRKIGISELELDST